MLFDSILLPLKNYTYAKMVIVMKLMMMTMMMPVTGVGNHTARGMPQILTSKQLCEIDRHVTFTLA